MIFRRSALSLLARRLSRRLPEGGGAQLKRLGEQQILVNKGMVDSTAAQQGMKSPARVPGTVGYEVYVALRAATGAPTAPSQRARPLSAADPVAWEADTTRLTLETAARSAEWELLRPEGDLLIVRVRCGTDAPRDEIDDILTTVEQTMLRNR